MAERQAGAARQAQAETEQYIQSVASTSNSADQIASAKVLLDDGTITEVEYDRLKEKHSPDIRTASDAPAEHPSKRST